MITIARLFGKSPFAPLQTHMKRVANCIEKLTSIVEISMDQDVDKIEKLAKQLSNLWSETNYTKNDIRNHLPKSLFLPIDRSHFLDILSIQNKIADQAEEIGALLSFKPLEVSQELQKGLFEVQKKSFATFWQAKKIIEELDELLESSFGGLGAEKVKSMVEQTAALEHEARQAKRHLMKIVLSLSLSAPAFYLWQQFIEWLGTISEHSERLANRIRMILELK